MLYSTQGGFYVCTLVLFDQLIETSSESNLVRGKMVCELIAKTLIKLHHKWLIQNPVGHGP